MSRLPAIGALERPGFGDVAVKTTGINDVIVGFDGSNQLYGSNSSISGTIDRVTGDVDATQAMTDAKTGKTISSTRYLLKCRPTQGMF